MAHVQLHTSREPVTLNVAQSMIRIFTGLSGLAAPCRHYASLRADGFPDTVVAAQTTEEAVRIIVQNHRGAVRARRQDKRRKRS